MPAGTPEILNVPSFPETVVQGEPDDPSRTMAALTTTPPWESTIRPATAKFWALTGRDTHSDMTTNAITQRYLTGFSELSKIGRI
jgi:hypothetical protein